MLDDENAGREVFRTRHGKYVDVMKEARGRMEAEIIRREAQELSEPAQALAAAVGSSEQVTLAVKNKLKPPVEGEPGTKLRTEAAYAAYGEKKVSKKVYLRILAGLEKYQEYHWTRMPPVPKRPENATVECEQFSPNCFGRIISTSPEYDAWEAARMAAEATPEYAAWTKEFTQMGELRSALIERYDPLKEGDLDGDDGCPDDGETL
jgi:hypothetical protein